MKDTHPVTVSQLLKVLLFLLPLYFLGLWTLNYFQAELGQITILLELITLPLLIVQLGCWGYGFYLLWSKSVRDPIFISGLTCTTLSVIITTFTIF